MGERFPKSIFPWERCGKLMNYSKIFKILLGFNPLNYLKI